MGNRQQQPYKKEHWPVRCARIAILFMVALLIVSGCGTRSGETQTAASSASSPPAVEESASRLGGPSIALLVHCLDVLPGQNASVTIKTEPGGLCFIAVQYYSGLSVSDSLKVRQANDEGISEWKWKVSPTTKPGEWPVTIVCAVDDRLAMRTLSLVVREPPSEETPNTQEEDAKGSGE